LYIPDYIETQYAVVKHIAKKNKWNLSTEPVSHLNFDICWTDSHVRNDLFARMGVHQKINHFPGKDIIIFRDGYFVEKKQLGKKFNAF
jgi:hypothetical protein